MFSYFLNHILMFLLILVLFLSLTIIIATITLVESKVLSLVQRSVGPNYVGYNGRLQFIADAVNLLLKHILVLNSVNKLLFIVVPCAILIMCYLFWMNLIWAPNLSICDIEYNLVFMGLLSILFSTFLIVVGVISNNKYAYLSSFSVLLTTLNLEIFLNFINLYFLVLFESFSFFQIVNFQADTHYSVFVFLPIIPLVIIVFLLETGSIPFDLGEAESELIAGYTTEMGGFFFALFYLGEYFHLYCFSVTYSICFFGGWFI